MGTITKLVRRNKLVRRVVRSDTFRQNKAVQAWRHSVKDPVRKAGAKAPVGLRVTVGARVEVTPGSPLFFAALGPTVQADPLRLGKYDRILIWRTNADPLATDFSNWWMSAMTGMPPLALIDERNDHVVDPTCLLEMLTTLRVEAVTEALTEQRNLIVILNPPTATPILMSRMWTASRVIVVLTEPTTLDAAQFDGIDGLLIAENLDDDLAFPALPFVSTFSSMEDVAAQVRALISGTVEMRVGYHFSLFGDQALMNGIELTSNDDLVLLVRPGWRETATHAESFGEWMTIVLEQSLAGSLHSRFLYSHETMLRREQHQELIMSIIERGARTRFIEAAA